jgi:hypothetical protein
MDLKFEKYFDEHVKEIKSLTEELKKNPENVLVRSRIKEMEKALFDYVKKSAREYGDLILTDEETKEDHDLAA